MFLSSNAALDDILKAVKNVSEIADAVGEEVKTATLFHEENVQENLPANTSAAKPAEQAVHKENKPAQTKSKPAGKPVTNRTVRVDIEKLDALMNQVSELIIAKTVWYPLAPRKEAISRISHSMSRLSIWKELQPVFMNRL